ncbi:zinc finger protein ZIPIC-like [Amblyomma americanum]
MTVKRNHVTRHERTHKGERHFVSHVGNKGFTQRGNLSRHMLMHSGEKPHKCPECGQHFRQGYPLLHHRRRQYSVVGGTVSHLCPCDWEGLSEKFNYERHVFVNAAQRPQASSHVMSGDRFKKLYQARKQNR